MTLSVESRYSGHYLCNVFPAVTSLLTVWGGGCHMVALCSSSLGSRGSELHPGAHSNTSPSQEPASTFIVRTEPSFDEQLADGSRICRRVSASHLLTTRSEGEQRQANDSEHIKWVSLPHHALWEILQQLQWERRSSGAFRSVCKGWQEAHDSMVSSLRLERRRCHAASKLDLQE
jgi:hypothetical protein